MAQVTKFRCDFCNKEVEDPYVEPGWIKIDGSIKRSWGIRKQGRNVGAVGLQGVAQTDFLKDVEFCGITCLVSALNRERAAKQGPEALREEPLLVRDPFPATKEPWEDPIPDDHE